VARAATSIVALPSENTSDIPPPPPPKPVRRQTAPDMNSSHESRPSTATKSRIPPGFSSITKMSLPKLPSLGHRVRGNENRNESIKPTHKTVVPNTTLHTLAQSLKRPLPPPPPPHDYSIQAFPVDIQPDVIPSHTNYHQRATSSTTRSSSSRPTGLRKPSSNHTHHQEQSQSQRGRERGRHEQTTRAKSAGRMTRVFSQFVN
jgi:hypothetical protein